MNTCLTAILIAAMATILSACADNILEIKEVPVLQLKQIPNLTVMEINLMGSSIHSALTTKKINILQNNDSLQVLVHIGLVGMSSNESGDFNYTFVVHNNVNSITFGKKKRIIWSRDDRKNKDCYQLRMHGTILERIDRCDLEEQIKKRKEENMIFRAKVLEIDYMASFQVKETLDGSQTKLQLLGSVNHNSIGINNIVILKDNKTLQVHAYTKFFFKKNSDDLNYTLSVPEDIDTVTFGEEKKVIWIRHADAEQGSTLEIVP